jgi:threonine dehydrogenase-like Zn-dependent dehydrogenase
VRGLWLEGGRLAVRDDLPEPEAGPGEAVVRVRLAGVCGTDLELVHGYYPFAGVPGHEFVGEVAAAPGAEDWVGRRVVGEINAACGSCPTCVRGDRTHCERRTVLGIKDRHGAFAERLALPLANLHPVPEGLPDEAAVFVEPLAAALRIQEQVRIGPGDRVLVLGPGRLGRLVARSLAPSGCTLEVAGRREAAALAPRSADVVVDCTGSPQGLALARRAVRPRGTVVLKSTYHGEAALNLSPVVVDELTLVGSRCGPFPAALAALAEGRVAVRDLIAGRYPLVEAPAAFAHAAGPGVLKILVEP